MGCLVGAAIAKGFEGEGIHRAQGMLVRLWLRRLQQHPLRSVQLSKDLTENLALQIIIYFFSAEFSLNTKNPGGEIGCFLLLLGGLYELLLPFGPRSETLHPSLDNLNFHFRQILDIESISHPTVSSHPSRQPIQICTHCTELSNHLLYTSNHNYIRYPYLFSGEASYRDKGIWVPVFVTT